MSSDKSDYKSLQASTPPVIAQKNLNTEEKKRGWIGRKYYKIKKAAGEFWVAGRYGFQLGGIAGLILGFFVGGFESIRMKSIWPMPLAMLGSGFTFGSIFAISTVIRSEENYNYSNASINIDYVYYDETDEKFKKGRIGFIDYNLSKKNNKI